MDLYIVFRGTKDNDIYSLIKFVTAKSKADAIRKALQDDNMSKHCERHNKPQAKVVRDGIFMYL